MSGRDTEEGGCELFPSRMSKHEISFTLDGLEARSVASVGTEAADSEKTNLMTASILNNIALKQLPEELQFGRMGGCPVVFRSGIVRLAFMKISATGVLAALVALSATNKSVSFSCCLAAAVNLAASIHYYPIWRTRVVIRVLYYIPKVFILTHFVHTIYFDTFSIVMYKNASTVQTPAVC